MKFKVKEVSPAGEIGDRLILGKQRRLREQAHIPSGQLLAAIEADAHTGARNALAKRGIRRWSACGLHQDVAYR